MTQQKWDLKLRHVETQELQVTLVRCWQTGANNDRLKLKFKVVRDQTSQPQGVRQSTWNQHTTRALKSLASVLTGLKPQVFFKEDPPEGEMVTLTTIETPKRIPEVG